MSYVDKRVDQLRKQGIYGARRVDPDTISKVLNMDEWEYYSLEPVIIESYLGLLAQQISYIQQECNMAEAKEIELGTDFKVNALPMVIDSKIRSVEERWLFASTLSDEMSEKFRLWQEAIIETKLKKNLAEPITEKLLVLKKIYDEIRMEGKNKTVHNYDGKVGGG